MNSIFIGNFSYALKKNENDKQVILHHICPHIISLLNMRKIALHFYQHFIIMSSDRATASEIASYI